MHCNCVVNLEKIRLMELVCPMRCKCLEEGGSASGRRPLCRDLRCCLDLCPFLEPPPLMAEHEKQSPAAEQE